MIELRWTQKKIGKVLQYRTWQLRIDGSGALTPCPLPIDWTEWTDVEDLDAHERPPIRPPITDLPPYPEGE